VSLAHTPWYHCSTRCVRRAFLCGEDRYTGQCFDHRKAWLEARFTHLSGIFSIDVGAYAVMSNHYHVVLRIDAAKADRWSDAEVLERWGQIFSVTSDEPTERIAIYRQRLCSLSWFMRCINEPLARRSNKEDGCKGRFWEGRFNCQALLDDAALIRCMTYVDLNPIRAGIAGTPEVSDHTSIQARIEGRDAGLLGFREQGGPLPLYRDEYLGLVDWTGRQLRRGKQGKIAAELPPIVERLNYSARQWQREMTHYGKWYYRAVGGLAAIENYCEHLGQQWLKGMGPSRATIFDPA